METFIIVTDILATLSSVIIAATGKELAEIQKINEEDGSLGDEGSSDQVSATTTITTTTTTTEKPSTVNGTTKPPTATKSPEEVKEETKQRVSISELKFVANVIHNYCIAVICNSIVAFQSHHY